jgi:hypothetical protein
MDKKKILLIIAFIAVAGLIAFGLYYFFFRAAPAPEVVTPTPGTPTGALPGAPTGVPGVPAVTPPTAGQPSALAGAQAVAQGGLTQSSIVANVAALSTTLGADGKTLQYWNSVDGKFYRVTADGLTKPLSNEIFYNVENVTWSPDKNKALLEYPDDAKIIYNFDTQKQFTIPKHWTGFSFSPQSDKIVSMSVGNDPDNRWLIITNTDGTGTKAIEPLGENADKVTVSWAPTNQIIAFSRTGELLDIDRQEIIPIGQNHENFKSFTVEGLGFQPMWSSAGDKLLYSVYNADSGYRPTLWVANASSNQIGAKKQIQINTWADKCTISGGDAYCAVPTNLDEGAGFDETIADGTPDVFYKIDLTTGSKTLLAVPQTEVTAKDLQVSADGQYLFYTDKLNGQIYKIRLR